MENPDDLVIWLTGPQDVDEVMRLAIAASDENGFLPADPRKLLEGIWPALNRDHGLCAAIGRKGGAIEGVILLNVGQMWYSRSPIVEERAIFIDPDYRSAKGGRAARLAEYAKSVADGLELPLVIGVLSNERTRAKVRMYGRIFGEPSGAFFIYGAKTGQYAPEIMAQ